MDYIDKHLASGAVNAKYLPSIRASMLLGKQLLNKYYNMTDHSEVYRIAMGKLFFSILLLVSNSFLSPRPQA
jgi:hypothetical protein